MKPCGCQADSLAVRWSELVCYWSSAAQSGRREAQTRCLPTGGAREVTQLVLKDNFLSKLTLFIEHKCA